MVIVNIRTTGLTGYQPWRGVALQDTSTLDGGDDTS